MTRLKRFGLPLLLSLAASAGIAPAEPGHPDRAGGGHGMSADAGAGMHGMMERMRGHGGMGGPGMMTGAGHGLPRGLVDPVMLRALLDTPVLRMPTPDELRQALQARMQEFDADGDGTLSIAEFEALHSALIRERMVDRFQHLDADGDGRITGDEMEAPAARMEQWQQMRGRMDGPAEGMMRDGAGNGMMMDDRRPGRMMEEGDGGASGGTGATE